MAAGRLQMLALTALATLLLYASPCSHDDVDFRQFLYDPNKSVFFREAGYPHNYSGHKI